MSYRFRPWHFSALVILACVIVIGSIYLYQARERKLPELIRHLPRTDGVTLYLDVRMLRNAGIVDRIDSTPGTQEPEYRAFVKQTGFDYRQDLDCVLARFTPSATYLIVTGRFRWNDLTKYVLNSQGECLNGFCQMSGSEPDRKISFLALNSRTMGLAVSSAPGAAFELRDRRPVSGQPLPAAPFWMSFSPAALRASEKFPAGTQLFAKALADADKVTLTVSKEGENLVAGLEARCHSSLAAQSLLHQMTGLTELVRTYITRTGQKPNPADLSGVLTSGTFTRQDAMVKGRWPIEWAFVDALGSAR